MTDIDLNFSIFQQLFLVDIFVWFIYTLNG